MFTAAGVAVLVPTTLATGVWLTESSAFALAAACAIVVVAVLLRDHDTSTWLCLVTLVLLLMPANQQVGALGSVGAPATMLAIGSGGLWLLGRLGRLPGLDPQPHQPVRTALFCLFAVHLLSVGVAYTRALDLREASAANRGLVTTVSIVGIALLAADTLVDRRRLEAVLKAVALAGAGAGLVGVLQFTTGYDATQLVQLPGLSAADLGYKSIDSRSGFPRVSGAALHAIEYSVLLAMALPFAIHYAWLATGGARLLWWPSLAVIGLALPMTVSRTAAVAVGAVALVLVPTWSARQRKVAIIAAVGFAVLAKVLWPGLLGTIRALFFSASTDPSIASRQSGYESVTAFLTERPILGRGFGTFLPDRYDYLDNQYFMSLVETGVLGVAALIGVFLTSFGAARAVRRSAADKTTRDLGTSLSASLLVMIVTCATFDLLSFPTARLLGFLLIGCAAALWRIEVRDGPAASARKVFAMRLGHGAPATTAAHPKRT